MRVASRLVCPDKSNPNNNEIQRQVPANLLYISLALIVVT